MKALFGRPPNLPWWQLKSMTDTKIAAYNRSFMVEVKMSDIEIYIKDDPNEATIKALVEMDRQATWNAAIEAVLAKLWLPASQVEEIRRLKK